MISDPLLIAIVTAVASLITTALTLRTNIRITQLQHNTNAITEHLVKTTAENEFAKGVKAGEAK